MNNSESSVHPRVCGEQAVSLRQSGARWAVHPRVCGEQKKTTIEARQKAGSSPRVRGTVGIDGVDLDRQRFIPACAGNRRKGHPIEARQKAGSSPRVRGTDGRSREDARPILAPVHPRVCGEQNVVFGICSFAMLPVHPRVCGEQLLRDMLFRDVAGSSPRVRGTAVSLRARYQGAGGGSSPRVRGTEPLGRPAILEGRFIPACAGNSGGSHECLLFLAVHPRVCGEQLFLAWAPGPAVGSSPRVRGTVCLESIETSIFSSSGKLYRTLRATQSSSLFFINPFDRREADEFQPVKLARHAAIVADAREVETLIIWRGPAHHCIALADPGLDLSPDALTNTHRILSNIDTCPDFQQPNRQPATQIGRGIVNRDDQHRRSSLLRKRVPALRAEAGVLAGFQLPANHGCQG